ncbi:hypothetical protein S83_034184 [Arachis hypogaea]|uniref:Uncharacterized protein n=1 Tax=Arachis hypogaea TaxID=3818 RepID=A0A445AM42_ARAHY|nr:hypothetical protein Ahy_B01g051522 isoform B [Arachis hypogaea]
MGHRILRWNREETGVKNLKPCPNTTLTSLRAPLFDCFSALLWSNRTVECRRFFTVPSSSSSSSVDDDTIAGFSVTSSSALLWFSVLPPSVSHRLCSTAPSPVPKLRGAENEVRDRKSQRW